MEFTYKLNEAEYLLATQIKAKRLGRPRARALTNRFLTLIFRIVWGALAAGMLLERMDLVGITAGDIQHLHTVGAIIPASIVPALAIFCLVLLLLSLRPLRWLARKSRLVLQL